jgi:hypothetical protein
MSKDAENRTRHGRWINRSKSGPIGAFDVEGNHSKRKQSNSQLARPSEDLTTMIVRMTVKT